MGQKVFPVLSEENSTYIVHLNKIDTMENAPLNHY